MIPFFQTGMNVLNAFQPQDNTELEKCVTWWKMGEDLLIVKWLKILVGYLMKPSV
jgi:hypothetical protein